jgi:hypothetical protein
MMPGHSGGPDEAGGWLKATKSAGSRRENRCDLNNDDPEPPPSHHLNSRAKGSGKLASAPIRLYFFWTQTTGMGAGIMSGLLPCPGRGHTTSRVSPLSGSSNYSPL